MIRFQQPMRSHGSVIALFPQVKKMEKSFCGSLDNVTNDELFSLAVYINPYPTAFPYGNGMVLHFYQQQESSMTKTVHKVINRGLKAYVYSPHTDENFH